MPWLYTTPGISMSYRPKFSCRRGTLINGLRSSDLVGIEKSLLEVKGCCEPFESVTDGDSERWCLPLNGVLSTEWFLVPLLFLIVKRCPLSRQLVLMMTLQSLSVNSAAILELIISAMQAILFNSTYDNLEPAAAVHLSPWNADLSNWALRWLSSGAFCILIRVP